ncbi:hypothetical protein VTI74DRAFT_8813 [Chaetomium olivicolor]
MRLINTKKLKFTDFLGTIPQYTILWHTWGNEKVSLQETDDRILSVTSKEGYQKIVDFCRLAVELGYTWAWVDTCCIDKSNLSELAESINSMFRWYQEAAVCCVFLAVLPGDANLRDALPRCRWFTRGWTLQELLAPSKVQFYDREWTLRGTKANLTSALAAITGIMSPVLNHKMQLQEVCIGTRMSWAADRETTHPEDVAYCLLGIFDVSMPLIYGKGEKAFRRLQEEIIRQSNDLTIFGWNQEREPLGVPISAAP